MTIFPPIELVNEDLIYNPGNDGDYDEIPDPDANKESTRIPSLSKDVNQSHGPFIRSILFIE